MAKRLDLTHTIKGKSGSGGWRTLKLDKDIGSTKLRISLAGSYVSDVSMSLSDDQVIELVEALCKIQGELPSKPDALSPMQKLALGERLMDEALKGYA